MKYMELFNTDPLAQIALVGLALVIVVTVLVFGFLMTRKNDRARR
ncbi:MAG: hypothetical protein R3D31_11820 [Hyphomicrobiaceae bacterium]